ncbi:hypothetical protein CMK19_01195 [Candidatus Poribacteria bacterium]|nr:hypothetical protein [Candidatus Poribacteria bacterium]|tara:strand:- start:801 stop:1286 length:486 start_codon:yes stop_codon:yes gene_type:complete
MSNYAKKYSFQSVGELDVDFQANESAAESENLPIGIKTPLSFGGDEGLLKMHKTYPDALADNFRNMIMTNYGERLGHYDFGGNLGELVFEIGSEDGDYKAMQRIARTTKKYMPFITLLDFEPLTIKNENKSMGKIGIRVTFSVPQLDNKKRAVEVLLFAAA